MTLAGKLARRFPPLRRVLADRERLRADCRRLRVEHQAVMLQHGQCAGDLARIRAEIAHVDGQRDRFRDEALGLLAETCRLQSENDWLRIERQRLTANRDCALAERDELRRGQWVPPGHEHSPVPDLNDLRARQERIWPKSPRVPSAVNLNEAGQMALLHAFEPFYPGLPAWPAGKQEGLRYYSENGYYPIGDATLLACILRYLRPLRILEVGSGFSSCVMLDINERFFQHRIRCTFVEPYPQRLQMLLKEDDFARIELVPMPLQDVGLARFQQLGRNDVLFIDSTHVSKCGSDVNHIFFEVLPALAPGVWVHIHDIHYPFEYRQDWVLSGKNWSEAYLLRAFLQHNRVFEIQFWLYYLREFGQGRLWTEAPRCLRGRGSGIWLRKSDPPPPPGIDYRLPPYRGSDVEGGLPPQP